MLRAVPVVDKQSEKAHGKAFKARLKHSLLWRSELLPFLNKNSKLAS